MTDTKHNSTQNASHTPGEWSLDGDFIMAPDPSGKHPDIYIAVLVDRDDEDRIAPFEQLASNGRLLAAAPEMFTELSRIHVGTTITTEHFNRIQRLLDAVCGVAA